VRADEIVLEAETVEPSVLAGQRRRRWTGRLVAERAVQALMPAVLIGAAGIDPLGTDPQLQLY
jgi:hypothetical protein